MKIYYKHLFEWMDKNKINYKLLAEAAHPVRISYQTISTNLQKGRRLPSDVILAWAKYYKWSRHEMNLYCLNGEENELKPLTDYSVEELQREIFRRCTA